MLEYFDGKTAFQVQNLFQLSGKNVNGKTFKALQALQWIYNKKGNKGIIMVRSK